MWACAAISDLGRGAAVLAAVLMLNAPATAQPQRVVSMNLCTDQLAMLLAAPGQLVSVSYLAHDPNNTRMAETARALPANHGLAEDIVMLRPDLVLAGRYSASATVAMLERLGVPVAVFEIENSLDDVTVSLRRMGEVLGRVPEAEALIARFEAERAALAAQAAALAPARAALWYAGGYTGGRNGLAGAILIAAGLDNIADELGLDWGGWIALERLLLAGPDLLVTGRRYAGFSEAQAMLDHPALRGLPGHVHGRSMTERDWICGTPHVLSAVAALLRARGLSPEPE